MSSRNRARPDIAGRPTRPQRKDCPEAIEAAIRTAGSIGGLERLAGIPQDHASRTAFWKPFMHLPGEAALDAGCAELKRLIRLRARSPVS